MEKQTQTQGGEPQHKIEVGSEAVCSASTPDHKTPSKKTASTTQTTLLGEGIILPHDECESINHIEHEKFDEGLKLLIDDIKLSSQEENNSVSSVNAVLNMLGCSVIVVVYGDKDDDRFVFGANNAYYNLLGLTAQEFKQHNLFAKPKLLLHPDDIERVFSFFKLSRGSCVPFRVQYRLLHRSGRYIWVNAKSIFLGYNDKGKGVYLSMIVDITAEHKFQSTISSNSYNRDRFNEIFQQRIIEYDCNEDVLRYLNASNDFKDLFNGKLTNYQTIELTNYLTKGIYEGRLHPEDIPKVKDALINKSKIDTERPYAIKLRLMRSDGKYDWYTCTYISYVDTVNGHIKVLVNITNEQHSSSRYEHLLKEKKIDKTTQLLNLESMIRRCRALIACEGDLSHSLMVFEIDYFEELSAALGKVYAESVIKTFAHSLRYTFRKSDYISHVRGKRFAVMAKDCDAEISSRLYVKLQENFAQECEELPFSFRPTFSMGCAVYPDSAYKFDDLRAAAIDALVQAQSTYKRGSCHIHTSDKVEENRIIALNNFEAFEKFLDTSDIYATPITDARAAAQILLDRKQYDVQEDAPKGAKKSVKAQSEQSQAQDVEQEQQGEAHFTPLNSATA